MSKHTSPWAIALVVVSTVLVTAAQAAFKASLNRSPDLMTLVLDPLIWSGLVLMALSAGLFIIALKYGELSVLHPVLSLGFVWVVFFSQYLGEHPGAKEFSGVAAIIVGVALISRSRGKV